jgi:hypothetical protein
MIIERKGRGGWSEWRGAGTRIMRETEKGGGTEDGRW